MTNNITPKVAVIVPAYNSEKFISQALDSVLRQTYSNWECIIVDDGSTDNTAAIVKQYCQKDGRFRYFYQNNSGPCIARNTAMANSNGEFILPIDSDNYIADTYMEKAVNRFQEFPETELVYGLSEKFGKEAGIRELPDYSYDQLLFVCNMIDMCAMFRRSSFNRVGVFHSNVRGLEDWDLWIGMFTPESVVYRIPEVMFYYQVRDNSVTADTIKAIQKLHQNVYWNNAQKYDRYLPNFTYHRYYGHDCEQILKDVPELTREKVLFFQRHVFLSAGEYTWKHAIINKIAKLLGLGIVFYKKEWQ